MVALRIEQLCKRYGRTVAVDGLSLTVERGQLYGLLGPNGSGKTTTLACALGLLQPTSGRLEVLGVPSARLPRTRGKVGVVFDAPTLVPGLTCRQNLQYARRLLGHTGGRGPDEALELVGLGALPGHRASRLSLGQARRLSIARILLGRPELLVLDEPLSGLDTVGVRGMLDLFATLREAGLTLLLSSHRLHEMERIVSHVAILMGGRLVREAPLDDLLGGQDERLLVRVTPRDRAQQLLATLDGVTSTPVADEADGDLLHVYVGPVGAAAVNRALVDGGCEVASLAPERRSLQAVFEGLLDEHLAGAVA